MGGIGVPHTPTFPPIVDRDADGADALRRLYGERHSRLESMAPDVIVFVSSDHYNLCFAAAFLEAQLEFGHGDGAWTPAHPPA